MRNGYLHSLINILEEGFSSLGGSIEPLYVEKLAVTLHQTMLYRSRHFHNLEHACGFLDSPNPDPVISFAALFHDLIYIQVDEGLPHPLEGFLGPYMKWEDNSIQFSPLLKKQEDFPLCCVIFGRDIEEPSRPKEGLNEFLSGVCFCLLVGNRVPLKERAAILLCIEATIPFRGPNKDGKEVGELLRDRIAQASPHLSSESMDLMVHRAIRFANKDVMDFAHPDPAAFLSNTWKLLPETNHTLAYQGSFSIREYRNALWGMWKFFRFLKPERIFHSYRGEPTQEKIQDLTERARVNLTLSSQYLRSKLLATTVLETIALLTGGDAPMALFMGDIGKSEDEPISLVHFLPPVSTPHWLQEDHPVVRLLRDGRLEESSFDLRNSPLALWLYEKLRPEEWARLTSGMEQYLNGEIDPEQFLSFFPGIKERKEPTILLDILKACRGMVPTRKVQIDKLIEKFSYST